MAHQPAPYEAGAQLIGEILVESEGLGRDVLERALARQRDEGGRIGEILVAQRIRRNTGQPTPDTQLDPRFALEPVWELELHPSTTLRVSRLVP